MPEDNTDVLMRIVGKTGPFPSESRTVFATHTIVDTLRKDFTPGHFCELREFSFSAGVAQAMDDKKKKKQKQEPTKQQQNADESVEPSAFDKFDAIRRSQDVKIKQHGKTEFVDMQPVEFTRILDSSSTLLFKAMAECDTLETISIVKRKAGGSSNSGACYLRLDFSKVLITDLSWTDEQAGHVMVETGTFIYRHVMIRYRPQNDQGTLGAVVQAEWSMSST